MQGQPVLQAGFVAHEQRLEAVKPGVEALNDQAAVEVGVERRVVGLSVGRASVARNVGLNAAPYAVLSQAVDVKGFVGIQKQAFQAQFSCFEQIAQLGKDPLHLEHVVLVTGLGRGHGQRQALVVGQKERIGRAACFAALIADGYPAVLGQRVAAIELDAGQVEGAPMQAQAGELQIFPSPLLAPGIKVVVHALPTQRLAREQGFYGQPAPLAASFELVADGLDYLGRVGGGAAATGTGG